jgi:hypothetical protein
VQPPLLLLLLLLLLLCATRCCSSWVLRRFRMCGVAGAQAVLLMSGSPVHAGLCDAPGRSPGPTGTMAAQRARNCPQCCPKLAGQHRGAGKGNSWAVPG